MDPSCLVSTVQAGGGGVTVWGIFLLLSVEHCLHATAWVLLLTMSIPLWAQCTHLLMSTSSRIPCHVTKLNSSLTVFSNMTWHEFTVLKWPPQSSDLHPMEHLWNVMEWKICIMEVQLTNLQLLRDAIMSTWSTMSKKCFQHLVQSMQWRIRAVLKAKEVPTQY